MNSSQTPNPGSRMSQLYSAERSSRIDSIPRIGLSSTGKRFSARALPPSTEMKVPFYSFSFVSQTKEKNSVSCDFSFYITGKALIVKSMEWKLLNAPAGENAKPHTDESICELVLETLKDFAVRHKASTIYASRNDIPHVLLLKLGFTATDAHDFMQLDVSTQERLCYYSPSCS